MQGALLGKVAAPAPPTARSLIALEPAALAAMQRTVALCDRLAHTPAWAARVDAGAPEIVRREPGSFGFPMGYDFHLGADGPRLIEINTNAGGALLNGLHTASLCRPRELGCLCSELRTREEIAASLVAPFRAEWAAAHVAERPLRQVVIADERPHEQPLRREFELYRELLRQAGIRAWVADTGDLTRGAPSGLRAGDEPVDLVYLRDTDFRLEQPRSRALRAAYLAGEVAVTPAPRAHHLLADKRRLALLSSREALAELGLAPEDAAFLAEIVPETHPLGELPLEQLWRERAHWVFKPAGRFGSRAVYRGDKISRRRFEQVAAEPDYVVQRRVRPGSVRVETADGPREMKYDVRAYAYRDRVLLLGARVYQGQVTNFRSPGGGFSAICTLAEPDPPGASASPAAG